LPDLPQEPTVRRSVDCLSFGLALRRKKFPNYGAIGKLWENPSLASRLNFQVLYAFLRHQYCHFKAHNILLLYRYQIDNDCWPCWRVGPGGWALRLIV
jgi:hypothetical protein